MATEQEMIERLGSLGIEITYVPKAVIRGEKEIILMDISEAYAAACERVYERGELLKESE